MGSRSGERSAREASSSTAAASGRIKYRSRTEPQLPATEEFSREEIDAVRLLKGDRRYKSRSIPTLGQLTLWLAELGGYTGKSSGGPPGTIVLRRGLQRVEPVVQAIHNLKIFNENPNM